MNKAELIAAVAKTSDMDRKMVEQIITLTFEQITDNLVKGQETRIPGFGVFDVSARAARTGRNPKTGEAIDIKASKGPSLRALKELKEKMNA